MNAFLAGLKRWWLRRFYGIVEPPAQYGGQGTTWKQWPWWRSTFLCECGYQDEFTGDTYMIREQEHDEDCELQYQRQPPKHCSCQVTDARFVKICPQCHRGHWKQAV